MGLSPPPLLRALLATLLATFVLALAYALYLKGLGLSVARELVVERRADKVFDIQQNIAFDTLPPSVDIWRSGIADGVHFVVTDEGFYREGSLRLVEPTPSPPFAPLLPPFCPLYDPCLCYTE